QSRQDTPNRRARDQKFLGKFLFREARAGCIFKEADAVADLLVDPLEPLPRHGERALDIVVRAGHTESITACRNCLVRSFCGAANMSCGFPCSQILPW